MLANKDYSSPLVHPTALIHPNANLAPSVKVGPYSIIDEHVEIGANCTIDSHIRIYSGTKIGENNRIDHGAVIGCEPQDLQFDKSLSTKLIIGDNNIFREGSNVSRGSSLEKATIIGNHNYFMATFHVGHDCILGDNNIFTHGTVLAGHVEVGNYAFISGIAAIHQFCRIGDYTMIAGCSKIVKDVPPYTVADGNPATLIGINTIGLQRSGFETGQRRTIKKAYIVLHKKKTGLNQALAILENEDQTNEVSNIVNFYKQSKRGVTTHR